MLVAKIIVFALGIVELIIALYHVIGPGCDNVPYDEAFLRLGIFFINLACSLLNFAMWAQLNGWIRWLW